MENIYKNQIKVAFISNMIMDDGGWEITGKDEFPVDETTLTIISDSIAAAIDDYRITGDKVKQVILSSMVDINVDNDNEHLYSDWRWNHLPDAQAHKILLGEDKND